MHADNGKEQAAGEGAFIQENVDKCCVMLVGVCKKFHTICTRRGLSGLVGVFWLLTMKIGRQPCCI